jgi:RNA polymerase sigma-70 factor, ECF subfamily
MFTLTRDKVSRASTSEFETLIRQSHRQSYSIAYRLTGNSADAEDLLQEATIRAFRFFHRYNPDMPFQSWMYRILSNAHVDMIRKSTKFKQTSIEQQGSEGNYALEVPDSKLRPDQELMNSTFSDPVQKGLVQMNSEFRMAVILADIEGMSYDEVAEIMETSVGTVRSRIHRGRVQLKSFLVRHSPEVYGRIENEL